MAGVLFICTGNLCRSPSAAQLLSQRLRQQGPADVTVTSAGTMDAQGAPPEELVIAADAFGLDLRQHAPRQVEAHDVIDADLVVGMTRQHVREAVVLDPPSFPKSFTLRELVRRGTAVGPRPADQTMDEWLREVHGGRRHLDLIGESAQDDIHDPMGGPPDGYRLMLEEVKLLIGSLHELLWPESLDG
jgi:protein-tyrosine phosphatase